MNICFNGKIVPADEPVLMASNRSYRYGDGLFETMKIINGKILLASFHFERLFAGLSLLKFVIPEITTAAKWQQEILDLCTKNKCENLARVRLSVFRGNGGLNDSDKELQYIIESNPASELTNEINEEGFRISIYKEARKACDRFSNLKSANFLPYTMAALHAVENQLHECLVLNTSGNIADATIANVFIIKNEKIITPSLEEGCVNGVMRRYVLEQLRKSEFSVKEDHIAVSDIDKADEIFLTNAINGLRWVKRFGNVMYSNRQTVQIYNQCIAPIFS